MFVRYRFDVKNHLKTGDNTLEVKFASPIRAALDLSSHSNYSIPPECPDAVQSGECHINFLRKMQASFSWDWGPAFPSVGIWLVIIQCVHYVVHIKVNMSVKSGVSIFGMWLPRDNFTIYV
ncbi:beta-mannosidase-like [Nilaparvata lugens]|uniref:beta-mannosidase-like n=1 Tax=Nilaparvata lugens TaxID=108931 RepID=UPI00193CAFF3|nr:beta-mannosidase-like [Nilaparvata lugens]